jgi:FHA domain
VSLPRPAASLVDDCGVRFPLGDRFVMGRSREADIVINSSRVTRHHVVLTRLLSGAVEAEDLDTTNGTRLNGEPLTHQVLQHGDALEIDANRFVFECEAVVAPSPDLEVLQVLDAGPAALEVWLDALVERGDPLAPVLTGERLQKLPAVLEDAVQSGELTLEWQRGLIRGAHFRVSTTRGAWAQLYALLDDERSRFLERLTVPALTQRFGLHGAPLTALRTLRVGPLYEEGDASSARKIIEALKFVCAPRLQPIEVMSFNEAWLAFPDDSSRRLRRGRTENVGGCQVRWGPGWLVHGITAGKPFRHNGRKVLSAQLAPGDEVVSGTARFTFHAR